MFDDIKNMIDIGAISAAFASFFNLIPHISSLLAMIWLGLRIYESRTVQSWVNPEKEIKTRKED